ncbi:MAG: hypothetical protein ACREB9_01715 [Thermoplasmata archaeon]
MAGFANDQVQAQLTQFEAFILSKNPAGGATGQGTITFDEMIINGLGSAQFGMTQLYPAYTLPANASLFASEWLELLRYYWAHLVPVLQFRSVADLGRTFVALATTAFEAKQSVGGNIGTTLHVRQVRPVTVYASKSSTTVTETWDTSVTAGWNTSFFPINLNVTNSSFKAGTTQNNVAMLILAVGDLDASPKFLEYQWYDSQNKPLGVETQTELLVPGSTGFAIQKQSLYVDRTESFNMDANFAASGASIPVIFGAEFVNSNLFTSE